MSHQPSVSNYKATCGAQDAARAYHAMDGLMQGEQRPTLDPKVNARWTKVETSIIMEEFSESKETPSLIGDS